MNFLPGDLGAHRRRWREVRRRVARRFDDVPVWRGIALTTVFVALLAFGLGAAFRLDAATTPSGNGYLQTITSYRTVSHLVRQVAAPGHDPTVTADNTVTVPGGVTTLPGRVVTTRSVVPVVHRQVVTQALPAATVVTTAVQPTTVTHHSTATVTSPAQTVAATRTVAAPPVTQVVTQTQTATVTVPGKGQKNGGDATTVVAAPQTVTVTATAPARTVTVTVTSTAPARTVTTTTTAPARTVTTTSTSTSTAPARTVTVTQTVTSPSGVVAPTTTPTQPR